jgi:hypothetical protein
LEPEQKQLPQPLLELLRIELLELPSMELGSMKKSQGQKKFHLAFLELLIMKLESSKRGQLKIFLLTL